MAYASYERQFLSLYAAGFINGAGTTAMTWGCGLTRVATGVYAATLSADAGLVDDESFTWVTPKTAVGVSGAPKALITVEDTSNLVKTIFVDSMTRVNLSVYLTRPADNEFTLEVALYRTVTRQSG
jgi:hypothetical protein